MISKNAQLNVKLNNGDCKIAKLFGENNLYSFELNDFVFSTKMLQFISGKEYTFVLEIQVDESKIKPCSRPKCFNLFQEKSILLF